VRDRGGEILEGKYRLVQRIGTGGMGSVWIAEHMAIGKRVAVKLLHRELAENEEATKRFHQEARAAAAAGHRGIVEVHDIGVTGDGEPYIVMELLEGESLGSLLARENRISVPMALHLALSALSALAAAHRRGIVHRDIKPDNVFLARTMDLPAVKLLDFGVSKMAAGNPSTTLSGVALGTPRYMAPEQARGDLDIDARADLWAMGVILYEALTGSVPFDAPTSNAVMVRLMTEEPRPPRELAPELPEKLEAIILRALAKEPADRFRRAEDMIEALLEITESETESRARLAALFLPEERGATPIATETPQTWSTSVTAVPSTRHRRAPIVLGALALVALVAIGVGWAVRAGDPAPVEAKWVAPVTATTAAPARGASPPEAEPSVTIALEGLPEGARVLLDDAVVPELPIRLPPRDVMLRLRVEADGHEPFSQMLTPDRDQTIAVSMARRDAAAATPRARPARGRAGGRGPGPVGPAGAAPAPAHGLPPIVDPGPGLPPIVDPGPRLPPIVPAGPPRPPRQL
jgi:serine/threonine-protein kinase